MNPVRPTQSKYKGFSLPEMMASLAVFSLIMVLVSAILRGGEDQVRLGEIKMNLQESARESLYRMALEVRESSPSKVALASGGAALSFQIPASVSNSGVITWSPSITYQLGGNGTQLVRITGGQTTVLANDIQSVAFGASGSPIATVSFSVITRRTMINGRILSVTSTGEAKLRNP